MLEKGKKYKYEEIKRIFDEVKMGVVLNPLDDDKETKNNETKLNNEADFTMKLMAISVIHTLEKKLFGKDDN